MNDHEKERNLLRLQYHTRPAEEKNIIKDIFYMHTEFDIELNKTKEIIDELSLLPEGKTERTEKAEEVAKSIFGLQSKLKKQHEALQNKVLKIVSIVKEKEDIKNIISLVNGSIEEIKFKIVEIENYEYNNIYSKKIMLLNNEIHRLSSLISQLEPGGVLDLKKSSLSIGEILSLPEDNLPAKLHDVLNENRKLDKKINKLNKTLSKEAKYVKDKQRAEIKRKRNSELQKKFEKINQEIKSLTRTENNSEYSKKIQRIDRIIGWKNLGNPVSPRNAVKNNSLIEDIEASLNRVKAFSTPFRS